MTRWDNRLSDTSALSAQLSYTYGGLDTGNFAECRQTVDLDVTHRFQLSQTQDLIWGIGYRLMVSPTLP